jgi:hypothetical protein
MNRKMKILPPAQLYPEPELHWHEHDVEFSTLVIAPQLELVKSHILLAQL